ncbi:MAG: Gfo/Idh/MocA family oxidoreductase, partial [Fimbriimonadales bacterium]|nr:Gfo/Idh/MocA family oxidoreductase [Fimbriimonadales bacterium]
QGLEVTEAQCSLPHFLLPEGWTVRLQGVYDENPAAAEQAASELETSPYSTLSALLEDEATQAVIIATPPFTHAELVQSALEHGKHVFCEKPMALRMEDCDAMLQAAQRAQRLLMVGHVLRLFPLFWLSRQLLNEGRIGRLLAVNVRRTGYDIELFSKGWRRVEAQSGGLVVEMNVHELDYMRWLGGEVKRVCAQGIRPMPGTDFVQHWQGLLEFEAGAVGTLEASMIDALGGYQVHLVGERGSMRHGGFGGELVVRSVDGEEERFTPEQVGTPDPYLWELVAFVRSIVLGEPLPFDGYDGRQAVALALACLQSMQTGNSLPPSKPPL